MLQQPVPCVPGQQLCIGTADLETSDEGLGAWLSFGKIQRACCLGWGAKENPSLKTKQGHELVHSQARLTSEVPVT